ncbi:PREDICTED: stearoyl-CoA desaturase 5-like isoform X2 [Papilio polytes]|nr:PREDICTED: stearoyl-CoA desaturase 5-like isoform X2 [Papilio polytes]XP_013142871.1 PREDICTED: stearoyl-CoA desaturase 5-like isoform X2 [Papilio polytes]XP_013142872.1 PREDICTED: stearoyl-CoA desaturase 5-like isoform X2 [Papilio polytes]
MAPAQQNVVDVCEAGEAQIKMRLLDNCYKDSSGLKVIENNNVIREDASEKTNSDNFDISVYESVEFRPRIKWPDLLVQLSLHLVSVYGLFLMLTNSVRFYTTIFVFATIFVSGFGITAGVHRLWSHRAYRATTPLRVILALLFTITGQRDIYTWALDHRVHHKYSESVADPHDVRRGFWFAHVGWLVLTPHPAVENRRAALRITSLDLLADPVVRIQKKYFIPLFALLNIALPVWIPVYYWDETLINSFVLSFVTRFTITLNIAFSVNSFAHLWGNKPYDKFIKPSENPLVSLAALGEGWHNYHHVFPWDYRTSELGRFNVSTNFIDLFAKIGWAYDLKAATPTVITNRALRSGDGSLVEEEFVHSLKS